MSLNLSNNLYIFPQMSICLPDMPLMPPKTNNRAPVLSSWQTETARGGRRETGRDLAKGRGLWDFGCGTSCVKVRWLHSVVGRRGGGGERGVGIGLLSSRQRHNTLEKCTGRPRTSEIWQKVTNAALNMSLTAGRRNKAARFTGK